ncbi:MAG TPA: hypothetical protein VJT75_08185 [Thermoleophilaceae bacterium]|nr:hypothetical protein [Thermoleophilaceae bacterium]
MTDHDRPLWTWLTTERIPGGGESYRQRLWSAHGGPNAGDAGKAAVRYTTKTDDYERVLSQMPYLVTDGRGGQVMRGGNAPPGHGSFLVREPGGRFHAQTFPAHTSFPTESAAINRRGDAVFAGSVGDHEVYALYRGHDGHVVGPVNLTPDDKPYYNGRAQAGIDAAGRAVVTWVSSVGDLYLLDHPDTVRAAMSDRRGHFKQTALVSGDAYDNMDPNLGVSPSGRAIVAWHRVRWKPDSDDSVWSRPYVARGHTPR